MTVLSSRVSQLVNRYHGGSVNAAAKDVGVPQPTLSRIVAGKVAEPRLHALERIAGFYNVSVGWLKGDRAGGPPRLTPWGVARVEWLRWKNLVESLNLPSPLGRALLDMPLSIELAHISLVPHLITRGGKSRTLRLLEKATGSGLSAGMAHAISAWYSLLAPLVSQYGVTDVREAIMQNPAFVLLGFHPFSVFLTARDRLPKNLESIYANEYGGAENLEPGVPLQMVLAAERGRKKQRRKASRTTSR